MARTAPASVAAYLWAQPKANRAALRQVRAVIRKALPRAEELVSYQIPAYRVDGLISFFFAGWAEHWSLYPVSAALAATLGPLPAGAELRKSTLRFSLEKPVPVRFVQRFVRARVLELADRARARAARV
jgi:uncharacterized protein YdhG (YjbR/CyaY superfamily)